MDSLAGANAVTTLTLDAAGDQFYVAATNASGIGYLYHFADNNNSSTITVTEITLIGTFTSSPLDGMTNAVIA